MEKALVKADAMLTLYNIGTRESGAI